MEIKDKITKLIALVHLRLQEEVDTPDMHQLLRQWLANKEPLRALKWTKNHLDSTTKLDKDILASSRHFEEHVLIGKCIRENHILYETLQSHEEELLEIINKPGKRETKYAVRHQTIDPGNIFSFNERKNRCKCQQGYGVIHLITNSYFQAMHLLST